MAALLSLFLDKTPPHPVILRFLAVLAGLTLASCSSSVLPKVKVAGPQATITSAGVLHAPGCAAALQQAATSDPASPGCQAAVEKFVLELQAGRSLHDWTQPVRVAGGGREWVVSFDRQPKAKQGQPEWSPGHFDRVFPASAFKLEGYDHIVAGDGAGTPLVLAFENVTQLRRERSFRPGNGLYVPATAVLEFGTSSAPGAPVPVRLRLYNTQSFRTAKLSGKTRPLRYNVTAALEASLANPYIVNSGLAGLLKPERRADDFGVFALNPGYDPQKIPVLFTHGLDSDASIWRNAVNEIYADPLLDARYQPILFLYPTGNNVPVSAARLRESLQRYRDKWDPDHNDPGMNRMVVVGHSLGGILSRMQVIDSGDDLRKAFFTRPLSEVPELTDAERARLRAGLEFVAQPFVKRAIFVAAPHRGSKVAELGIVKLVTKLIKLPLQATQLTTRLLTHDPGAINPALHSFDGLGLRSVDMLAPSHPYFAAIEARPIKVPYHSIIGDRGKGNSPDSSDGAVPYWSSHLKGAVSELIVPHGHSCTAKTETVQEISRILRLHAGLKSR